MARKNRVVAGCIGLLIVTVLAVIFFHHHPVAVLDPKGPIGHQERTLIYVALGLSLIVVIPVFALTFGIAWKYRASNEKAQYAPDWDHNTAFEIAWWAIPSVIILALSVVTWNSSHTLDPYRTLAAKNVAPLTVQVVALDWKWLFIYPRQGVAAVNQLELPVNTPVNFEVTADAPMNSFWIPQLGGQIYAMPGMITQLHLMASQSGDYYGSSANISGAGFAGMHFLAKATSQAAFGNWVKSSQQSKHRLDSTSYAKLAKASQNNPVSYYKLSDANLLSQIADKYMMNMDMSSSPVEAMQ